MAQQLEYILQKDALRILDLFTTLFDIRIAFISTGGEEIRVGEKKPLCPYCYLLRNDLGYENTCLKLDDDMRLKSAREKKLIYYECHGGMTEAIKPIVMEDDLIGFVMIGQFRSSQESLRNNIRKKWKKKFNNDKLENAFEQAACFPKEKTEKILQLFDILVDDILHRHMIELRGKRSIQPLMDFLNVHPEKNMDLSEGAKLVTLSRSGLAHKFKKTMGKSFKQYQIDLKLNKADEYFQKNPEISVKEVAFKLGFSSQFYFSRLYKKHRGIPPIETKKKFNQDESPLRTSKK